ncbi:MAG: DUF1788 domain-containing protein [Clostridia bacterium]|nr:DUF1788 domain-containing protein [Clostridia bacterium]
MGWHEVMGELEEKLVGTLRGTYRPLDNVPFFRVQYPPVEEREALRQFRMLTERLRHQHLGAESVSLLECLREALAALLNCPAEALESRLVELEREQERPELQSRLSKHLPAEMTKALTARLKGMPRDSVAVLLRMGSLYPFLRPSSILSSLEGRIECAVVLPYPGTTLGALLDAPPADPRGGYYRGEVIPWR